VMSEFDWFGCLMWFVFGHETTLLLKLWSSRRLASEDFLMTDVTENYIIIRAPKIQVWSCIFEVFCKYQIHNLLKIYLYTYFILTFERTMGWKD
jgi:hypothetical protein